MSRLRTAALHAMAAGLLLAVGGCATNAPLIDSTAMPVELVDTPFFPQQRYQCGPAALATVLAASGVRVTPAELEPLVYLPGRKGSLQVEMLAAPRGFARLPYRVDPELSAIVAELDAGRPVLVLHNYGLPAWPRWHYAVAFGHDPQQDQLVLRSGMEAREPWSARNFMRAWDNGDRWAAVMLRPGELPVAPDKDRYLEASAAFEKVATPGDAGAAFDAAIRAWPGEPVAWIGRGTARFRSGDLAGAESDYRAALGLDPGQAGARNNLAMALLEQGCPRAALRQLEGIDPAPLPGELRSAIADTQRQASARAAQGDGTSCSGR